METIQALALRELEGLDEAFADTDPLNVCSYRLKACALAVLRDAVARHVDIDDFAVALVKSRGSLCTVVLSKSTDSALAELSARFANVHQTVDLLDVNRSGGG